MAAAGDITAATGLRHATRFVDGSTNRARRRNYVRTATPLLSSPRHPGGMSRSAVLVKVFRLRLRDLPGRGLGGGDQGKGATSAASSSRRRDAGEARYTKSHRSRRLRRRASTRRFSNRRTQAAVGLMAGQPRISSTSSAARWRPTWSRASPICAQHMRLRLPAGRQRRETGAAGAQRRAGSLGEVARGLRRKARSGRRSPPTRARLRSIAHRTRAATAARAQLRGQRAVIVRAIAYSAMPRAFWRARPVPYRWSLVPCDGDRLEQGFRI